MTTLFQFNKILSKLFVRMICQKVNKTNNFNEWCKIPLGVPQESNLDPLLFNIFSNYIFYFLQEAYICIFTDNNSSFSIKDKL